MPSADDLFYKMYTQTAKVTTVHSHWSTQSYNAGWSRLVITGFLFVHFPFDARGRFFCLLILNQKPCKNASKFLRNIQWIILHQIYIAYALN